MQIGALRHKVTIQAYTANRDSFGAEVPAWTDIATVWASVSPLSGKEYFASQQLNAEVTTKITLRYLKGITPKMRVLYGGRVFNINLVIDLNEEHKEMHLMCKEVV